MKTLIFTGGSFLPPVKFSYEEFDMIICADKGIENAKKAGIKPTICVGDFDSTKAEGAEIVRFPAEKDVTDTEIAVDFAIEKGAKEILILGGTGGRADHTFANFLLLARYREKGVDIKLFDGQNLCFVINKSTAVEKSDFKYLSLFALFENCEGLTLKGTKYTLENYCLEPASSLGVSNEIVNDKAEIEFKKGKLLIILSKDKNLLDK